MKAWTALGVCAAGFLLTAGIALGKKPADDVQQKSQQALAFLLLSSAESIPARSSCQGIFGGENPPRIKDLLAMELATLSRGRNSISGSCDRGGRMRCNVQISHEYGESVSSAEIRFQVTEGHVDRNSIDCTLTP